MATDDPTAVTLHTDKHRIPFLVDADDAEAVGHYTWRISNGYPRTEIGRLSSHKGTRIRRLHIFLLGPAPDGLEWDHVNRNKLDNRRSNFRLVTHPENVRNVNPNKRNTSGVKGVGMDRAGFWRVRINVDGVTKYIGRFVTLAEAVAVRQAAERDLWR